MRPMRLPFYLERPLLLLGPPHALAPALRRRVQPRASALQVAQGPGQPPPPYRLPNCLWKDAPSKREGLDPPRRDLCAPSAR
eukprot:2021005-Pyramimonas_sp.AAC.1